MKRGQESSPPKFVPAQKNVPFCAVLCRFVPFCAVLCRFVPFCAILFRFVPVCAVVCRSPGFVFGPTVTCPLFLMVENNCGLKIGGNWFQKPPLPPEKTVSGIFLVGGQQNSHRTLARKSYASLFACQPGDERFCTISFSSHVGIRQILAIENSSTNNYTVRRGKNYES
jgi:hypothetical protein